MVDATALLDAPQPVRVRTRGEFPETEFVVIRDVPIFAEHETKGRNGRKLKFGRAELEAVASRCNRRIDDTGDYAAVTLGHTPEPGQGEPPQVVGFAGPFRVGEISDDKSCILADLHIYREDEDLLKRYPRRSPELWLEETYDEMFLDPVALLGSDAPRLDMGLLYSAQRNGKVVEKYTAVAPAAGNCFIPDIVGKKKTKAYAAGDGGMAELAPEALQQVIEVFDNLDWVKAVKDLLNSSQGTNATVPMPQPQAISGQQPLPADPADPNGPPPMNPADGLQGEEPPNLNPEADTGQEKIAMSDDRTKIEDDVVPTDEVPTNEEPNVELDIDVDADDDEDEDEDKDKDKAKYAKSLQSLRQDVATLKAENEQLRTVVNAETDKRINAERYQKLGAIRRTRCFELDKEMDRCRYSRRDGMSDEQFTAHVESIQQNYRPIPIGDQHLPTHGAGAEDPMHRERYSKANSDRAKKICEAKRANGEVPDYMTVLESLEAGEPVATH